MVGRPSNQCRCRSAGCSRRSRSAVRVMSKMSSHASSARQSTQEISLSWRVGVVVAALGAAALVAGGDHRDAVGQAQRRDQVGGLAVTQREHVRVVGLALDAAVPGPVVVGAVAVALAVGLVVLAVVGDEVAQREAVVGGDEVDRGVRRPAVVEVEVGGAGQPGRDGAHAVGLARQKSRIVSRYWSFHSTHGARELADAVAVHRDVPRLGDQLHVPQHRVLADGGQQVPGHVDVVAGAGQRRHQVEAEAVDVHLGDPVAQRVQDQPQHHRVLGVDGVAAAGDVPVGVGLAGVARLWGDPLVGAEVVEPAEAQRRPVGARLGGVVVDHVEDRPRCRRRGSS